MKEVVPKFTVQFNEHDDDDDDGTTNLREIVSKHSHSSRSAMYMKKREKRKRRSRAVTKAHTQRFLIAFPSWACVY